MVVIPSLLALLIGFLGMTALWIPLVQKNNIGVRDLEDFEKASTFMLQQIEGKLLENTNSSGRPKISDVATYFRNLTGYTVEVEADDGRSWLWGDAPGNYRPALRAAADQMDKAGIISTGPDAIATSQVHTIDGTYRIYIYGTKLKTKNWLGQNPAKIVGGLIFFSIIFAAVLANRFLTKFVFRHIQEALTALTRGVSEIRDGNLNIKIPQQSPSEFSPIFENFNDMAMRLKESVETIESQKKNRRELLAGMSHDLRSPLTSIKAYTEGLIDGVAKTPVEKFRYLAMIQSKTNDMENMIDNLFLFSKMEMDEFPYYPEVIDLAQEIQVLLQQDANEYKKKGLMINFDKIAPCGRIFADPMQFRRIISNILENSVKYKILPMGQMYLFCEATEERIQLILEDNGPGVQAAALGRLFDVFYRTDQSRSNAEKSSGLGLAIVYKVVQQMGGNIWAENVVPHGLRIKIEFSKYRTGLKV